MSKHHVDVHVGKIIRHRRWVTGMTQQQLASAVGIKFQQIQKYESGANRCSASRLWDISRALDVPVSYFFKGLEDGAETPQEPDIPDKKTATLLRAYQSIRPPVQRRLLDLARALAGQDTERAE